MKTLLLVAACLSLATAGYAQTMPTSRPPATTTPTDVSGTKNVGADRADAPQAPGMTTAEGTRTTSPQTHHGANQPRPKKAAARKQSTTQASPQ